MCKVVDNFGDAGFVVRLCRALLSLRDDLCLRVVCDDVGLLLRLEPAFALGDPVGVPQMSLRWGATNALLLGCHNTTSGCAPTPPVGVPQMSPRWDAPTPLVGVPQMPLAAGGKRVAVFDWNDGDACKDEFSRRPPRIILECFQCGRPLWLEAILFDSSFSQIVQIVNIEYLTAENWADGFHLLKSGTRAANVKKVNFMPGFSAKTGGLVLDGPFLHCKEDSSYARRVITQALGEDFVGEGFDEPFKVLLFSYPRDLSFLARAIRRLSSVRRVRVFVASGAGLSSATAALSSAGVEFCELPFLPQRVWDALMSLVDFAFVRGEDSFARACLLGRPFVWQAYPQQGQFHLVKLAAFLQRLATPAVDRFSFLYNWDSSQEPSYDVWDELSRRGVAGLLQSATPDRLEALLEQEAFALLEAASRGQLVSPFAHLSRTLLANGNLAEHLLAYLESLEV